MPLPPGDLHCTVEFAKGLVDKELFGKQDPYAVVELGSQCSKTKTHIDGGKAPVWGETFSFNVSSENELTVTVKDKNWAKDKVLGVAVISLATVRARGEDRVHAALRPQNLKEKGFVSLVLKFTPAGASHSAPEPPAPPTPWPCGPAAAGAPPAFSAQQPPLQQAAVRVTALPGYGVFSKPARQGPLNPQPPPIASAPGMVFGQPAAVIGMPSPYGPHPSAPSPPVTPGTGCLVPAPPLTGTTGAVGGEVAGHGLQVPSEYHKLQALRIGGDGKTGDPDAAGHLGSPASAGAQPLVSEQVHAVTPDLPVAAAAAGLEREERGYGQAQEAAGGEGQEEPSGAQAGAVAAAKAVAQNPAGVGAGAQRESPTGPGLHRDHSASPPQGEAPPPLQSPIGPTGASLPDGLHQTASLGTRRPPAAGLAVGGTKMLTPAGGPPPPQSPQGAYIQHPPHQQQYPLQARDTILPTVAPLPYGNSSGAAPTQYPPPHGGPSLPYGIPATSPSAASPGPYGAPYGTPFAQHGYGGPYGGQDPYGRAAPLQSPAAPAAGLSQPSAPLPALPPAGPPAGGGAATVQPPPYGAAPPLGYPVQQPATSPYGHTAPVYGGYGGLGGYPPAPTYSYPPSPYGQPPSGYPLSGFPGAPPGANYAEEDRLARHVLPRFGTGKTSPEKRR